MQTQTIQAVRNRWLLLALLGLVWLPTLSMAQETPEAYEDTSLGSPAYSYYQAAEIIESYKKMFGIEDTFQKKMISRNLRPTHVYERTLEMMEEFAALFPDAISKDQREQAYTVNPDEATSVETTYILNFIKTELKRQGTYEPYYELRSPKTPSDVYQIMRKLGWFHRQIAAQRGIETDWDRVERVYTTVVVKLLPSVYAIADDAEVSYQPYAFPRQPSRGVRSRNIYKLVIALYDNIMQAYALQQQTSENIVQFVEVNDCDEITPADVFDLEQIVAAELRLFNPELQPSEQLLERFETWKASQTKLAPGHTFRLLQHLYLLTEQVLEPRRT